MWPNKVKRGHFAVILTQLQNPKPPFLGYFLCMADLRHSWSTIHNRPFAITVENHEIRHDQIYTAQCLCRLLTRNTNSTPKKWYIRLFSKHTKEIWWITYLKFWLSLLSLLQMLPPIFPQPMEVQFMYLPHETITLHLYGWITLSVNSFDKLHYIHKWCLPTLTYKQWHAKLFCDELLITCYFLHCTVQQWLRMCIWCSLFITFYLRCIRELTSLYEIANFQLPHAQCSLLTANCTTHFACSGNT